MKEVKKCSISGVAFTLDADAYDALSQYLGTLRKTYGNTDEGREIVADIEARIAELILSHQDNTSVVEKPLVEEIIAQMGTAEAICDGQEEPVSGPRIPRRLYRDTENAKLGGVCAGIGKYFDIDPVWVRLGLFLPLLLTFLGWVPLLGWLSALMGNLFGIFFVCYLIMWFAVPAARTARQKLEMNGQRITAQSIGEATAAAADPDSTAKPVVARVVFTLGQVVLIVLKILAGLIVFGLIMLACALIIGLFALIVGGEGFMSPAFFCNPVSIWVASFGIVAVLIPTILLIYVLMCLIASRKPSGKTVLVTFIVWFLSVIALCTVAIRGRFWNNIGSHRNRIELLQEEDAFMDDVTGAAQIGIDGSGLHICIPEKVDIRIDGRSACLRVDAEGDLEDLAANFSEVLSDAVTAEESGGER